MSQLPRSGEAAVLSRAVDAFVDPVALYSASCDGGARPDTLLLESAERTDRGSGKSLVMTRAALRIQCRGRAVRIDALSPNGENALSALSDRLRQKAAVDRDGAALSAIFPVVAREGSAAERLAAPSPLDAVRAIVLNLRVVGGAPLAPLVLGSFGYDLLGSYEELPAARDDRPIWPDYELWLAEEMVVLDPFARRTTVLRYVLGSHDASASYHDAERGLARLIETCRRADVLDPPELPTGPGPTDPPVSDVGDAEFEALVATLQRHILSGDVFQIVASRMFSLPCPNPLSAYARLRGLNPSPYMFYLHGSAGVLFGASPESALTVRRNGAGTRRVQISPIAGTRARGFDARREIDPDLDSRIEAELRLDAKEIAEHMMLVDLARNDVARVSKPGSRTVDRLLDVVRYSHVMHLVSVVSGELKDDLDALHAYTATMNMGTLVGAPKIEAARLLRRYERARRGPYGGAVGYLTSDGEFDSCIVIRSARVVHGTAHVRAGAGIVSDSQPAAEAEETRRKADAVLAAIGSG